MKRVAVIGAGAAGLCCARHLLRYPEKFQFTVYEQSMAALPDQLLEPQVCAGSFSTTAGGRHYLWRGYGPGEKATTIGVYDPHTELWTLRPTSGPTPPRVCYGGCTAVGNNIYTFNGKNDLHKLHLNTFQWTMVQPKNGSSQWPLGKAGCGLVPVDEQHLGCFGGYGVGPTQSGSMFTMDTPATDGRGWTNEFHLFNLKQGVWSSPVLKGPRPPPCSAFSFTKIDRRRAVLFGGYQPDCKNKVNDVYLFDFAKMEVTKVEPVQGEAWPVGRSRHAACCLNYNKAHPVVLVSGGTYSDNNKVHTDMWIFDVDAGKWTQVTPSTSISRCDHSLTTTSLGPGLTEVLMFGGKLHWEDDPIAETTILRFELTAPSSSVAGPSTGKWALVDVAHNDSRGSEQRLRKKRTKIGEANHRASSVTEPTDHSLRDRVRSQEHQLQKRTNDAERRAAEALHREQATQHRLQHLLNEANRRRQDAERRLSESEHRLQEMSQEAKRQSQELTAENGRLQGNLQEMERRAQLAEQRVEATRRELEGKTRELEAHNTEVWRIPSNRIHIVRGIRSGGWAKVEEGTVRVAMKSMHPQLCNRHNLEKLHREIKLLAEVQHTNLVQFIGAVFDQSPPLIVTELLDLNLREAYEKEQLQPGHRSSIFVDIGRALDYLHQRYEPIIHRDVSAPNVLLQRMPNNQWKGKVSDLGSANFLQDARTMGEGAIVYSPPEVMPQAHDPLAPRPKQTVKIDVYSYGILLCEVCTSRFPDADNYRDMILQVQRQHPKMSELILACTKKDPSERLSMAEVLVELGKMASF